MTVRIAEAYALKSHPQSNAFFLSTERIGNDLTFV